METGLTYTASATVTDGLTAASMGSGDMAVLATPAMMALMEHAAMKAVADALPEGSTTVGAHISSSHLRPTAVGRKVSATAVLTAVEDRKLTFDIQAEDEQGNMIGKGTHVRYVVDRARFLSKI
ncbi:MAG: thioesterase family protein [Bacteroidaceae bacterium]